MFEQFKGQDCVVVVAFATSVMDGGAASANYIGTFIDETEDFIVVDVANVRCDSVLGGYKTIAGNTYINKKYIVSINFR